MDWLGRQDKLNYHLHEWIGEVVMSAAAEMGGGGILNQELNLNWRLFKRLRIVDVRIDGAGMEVIIFCHLNVPCFMVTSNRNVLLLVLDGNGLQHRCTQMFCVCTT